MLRLFRRGAGPGARLGLRPLSISSDLSNNSNTCEKPDFAQQFQGKHFDFCRDERSIYRWWDARGLFRPEACSLHESKAAGRPTGPPFVVPMPPPNVTGHLHMGHAMFLAVQDALVRQMRMAGREALWLPGT